MDALTAVMAMFSGNLTADNVSLLFHGALQADFTAWSVKLGIIWWLMGSKVKKELSSIRGDFGGATEAIRKDFTDHFAKIEKGFGDMVGEMKELKENVTHDLSKHSEKVSELTTRVEKLETKGV